MKYLVVLALLLTSVFAAPAEPKKPNAKFTLAYGWIKGADGKRHSLKGVQFEIGELIPISVKTARPIRGKPRSGQVIPPKMRLADRPKDFFALVAEVVGSSLHANAAPSAMGFSQTAYDASNGSYYVLSDEFADPSVLDDMVLQNGTGALWESISMGINFTADHRFLLRFQIFDSMATGQGPGVSAFTNILGPNNILGQPAGDFGGYVNPTQLPGWGGPGTYIVQFLPQPNAFWAGITCPDNTIYMAQQFRVPHDTGGGEDGEGAFDSAYKAVYNANVAPAVGTSNDGFYFDFDPQEGIYDEFEFEVLGDIDGTVTPFSNLLRKITTSGTLEFVSPTTASFTTALTGSATGDVFDVIDSDNLYMTAKPRWDLSRTQPNVVLQADGIAQNANCTRFKISVEAAGNQSGGTQIVDLWNWTTSAWDRVDSRAIPNVDAALAVEVTSNISRYVNSSTRRIRSRVGFFAPPNTSRSYANRVDYVSWTLTHP